MKGNLSTKVSSLYTYIQVRIDILLLSLCTVAALLCVVDALLTLRLFRPLRGLVHPADFSLSLESRKCRPLLLHLHQQLSLHP